MFETMLIVDDFDLEREMLTELMQDSFMVLEASNGKECLEVLESCQGHIDVVLLDLMMPELDGFGVLERRQELDYFKEIPVIVLTSSGAAEDQIKAFNLGANDFISKPIITDIAVLRINNVLASSRRLKSILKDSEELKVKSELDQMTGLYNKTTAEKIIDDLLIFNPTEQHGLLIIDIDNFKAVNDIEGHQVGDHTIKIIADLISSHFRKSDIVGRIGGDEFIVCMSNIPSETIARNKAKDIVRIMRYKPNMSIPANVSVSIGLAFTNHELTDYRALFQKADEALYYSKKNGKARYTEYGMEETAIVGTDRSTVILCSRNRNICSNI